MSCATTCFQNVPLANRCITNTSMNSISATNVSSITAPITTISFSTSALHPSPICPVLLLAFKFDHYQTHVLQMNLLILFLPMSV